MRQEGKRIWRGKCPSDRKLLAALISRRAPDAKRVVFETGLLSVWFFHALTAAGVPAICIDARHAKAALDMAANKTDANDADGLAQLAEVGFYREVRVKHFDSMLTRTLVGARAQMIKISTELSNQIRGLMKTFGLIVPKGAGRVFEANVRGLLAITTGSRKLCCHCSMLGAASGRTRQSSIDSLLLQRGTVRRAACSCRPQSGDGEVVHRGGRGLGELQNLALGRGVGGPDHAMFPIRRG